MEELHLVTVAAAVYERKIFEGAVEEWEAASFNLPPTHAVLMVKFVYLLSPQFISIRYKFPDVIRVRYMHAV